MGIPMYMRIQQYIRNQIESGIWKPGDAVPTEAELGAQFRVSRITVTTALRELVKEGIIYRVQGKGTYVADTGIKSDIYDFMQIAYVSSTLEEMQMNGSHKVLGIYEQQADEVLSSILQIRKDDLMIVVERMKVIDQNGQHVAERLYLPKALYIGMEKEKLAKLHMSQITKECGITTGKSILGTELLLSDERISELLECEVGRPILLMTMELYDNQDMPIAYLELFSLGSGRKVILQGNINEV